eukprot:5720950-Prymnesium_polylepis.1
MVDAAHADLPVSSAADPTADPTPSPVLLHLQPRTRGAPLSVLLHVLLHADLRAVCLAVSRVRARRRSCRVIVEPAAVDTGGGRLAEADEPPLSAYEEFLRLRRNGLDAELARHREEREEAMRQAEREEERWNRERNARLVALPFCCLLYTSPSPRDAHES